MSSIASYPRVPVKTRDLEEGTRRSSDAINFILDRLNIIADFAREKAYLAGLTDPDDVVSDGPIVNWDLGVAQSDNSLIAVNPVLGEVTVWVTGAYRISANFIGVMSGVNVDHSILIDHDPGGLGSWGTIGGIGINTSKANPGSIAGFANVILTAGDIVRLTYLTSSTSDTITAVQAQANFELIGLT